MSPVLRIFVMILTMLALIMGIGECLVNGLEKMRLEIALPCSLAFVIGAIILLFAKAEHKY